MNNFTINASGKTENISIRVKAPEGSAVAVPEKVHGDLPQIRKW